MKKGRKAEWLKIQVRRRLVIEQIEVLLQQLRPFTKCKLINHLVKVRNYSILQNPWLREGILITKNRSRSIRNVHVGCQDRELLKKDQIRYSPFRS